MSGVGIGLVVVGIAAGWQWWRLTAPPIPVLDTKGFDPVIAGEIAHAEKLIRSSPRSATARGHLGMVLLAHEARAPARECFTQAAAMAPREPRWPYLLGAAQLVDNPTAAATNLARAVKLFPEAESAPRLKLADTLLNLGRLDEAQMLYRQVWQRESNSAPASLGLGKVAVARDRVAEAAEYLDAATDSPSTRRAAYRLLLNLHQRAGRTNQADQVARILTDLPNDTPTPDPYLAEVEQLKTGEQAWIDLADEWIKAERVQEAARLLEKTVQIYPKSDRAMFFLGRARQRLGDAAGAEAILTQAVTIAPNSVEAQMQLGIVRLGRGRTKAAEPCFRAAIQAKPNLGQAWFNLGLSLGTGENRSDGIAAFREAIRLKPDLFEAYLGLAIALRVDGQHPAAAAELRRALALEPDEAMRQKLLTQLRLVE